MSPSELESHNKLPLLTLRARYLPSTLGNETHSVTLETSSSLSDAAFTRCFELVRDNLQDVYKRSSMGWSSVKKKNEMRHPAIRYLLLRTKDAAMSNENHDEEQGQGQGQEDNELEEEGNQDSWEDEEDPSKIVGFLSFMITEEVKEHVIYIYELQLAQSSQNQGLGKFLMNIAEDYGRAVGMPKAMLTCFSENVGAKRFYHRNGYAVDKISPLPKMTRRGEMREPSYYILGKYLREGRNEVEKSI